MSQKNRDPIEELNEWQEHQYNPGYWVNRFSPRLPPRKTKGIWILEIISLVWIVIGFIAAVIAYFVAGPLPVIKFSLWLFGIFTILALIRARNLKPKEFEFSQQERDEIRRKEKKEKKKDLPKRRKDYG
jgi:hypothetical protein